MNSSAHTAQRFARHIEVRSQITHGKYPSGELPLVGDLAAE
jgi:hypothetical protein